MPINFDPNSLNNVFDKNFGAGSYQAGLSNAANAAKLKQQAALAKSDFLKRLSAAQAKAKQDQAYMDKYGMTKDQYDAKKQQDAINKLQDKYQVLDNGLTSDQASKMRAKGDAEGRGGHQPSYDQQRKEAQQSDKNSNDLTSYDTSKMTDHNKELVAQLQAKQLQAQQAQQQQKKSGPGFLDELKNLGSSVGHGLLKAADIIDRPGDAVRTAIDEKLHGGSLLQGAKDGFTGKKNTDPVKFLRDLGVDPTNNKVVKTAENFLGRSVINQLPGGRFVAPFVSNNIKNTIGEQTAAASVATPLDPLTYVGVGAAPKVAKGVENVAMKGLSKFSTLDNPAFTGRVSQSTLDALAPKLQQGLNGFRQAEQQPLKADISNLPLNQSKVLDNLQSLTGIKPKQVKKDVSNSPLLMSLNPAKAAEKAKPEPVLTPTETELKNEFNHAVQQQVEYLKNSMGKGVDRGTTSNGEAGNFKQVTGTFNVSRNPKWYQDFYKQTGRKPNKSELEQLAQEHVLNGFQDEYGNIPAYTPKKIQNINDQIDEALTNIQAQPELAPVLKPYIDALHQEKAAAEEEYNKFLMKLNLQQFGKNEPKMNISSKPINNDPTAPNPLDNHGYGLARANEPKAKAEPKQNQPMPKDYNAVDHIGELINREAQQKPKTSAKEKIKSMMDNAYIKMVDDFYGGTKLDKAAGKDIQSSESATVNAHFAKGAGDKAVQELKRGYFDEKGNKIGKSFNEIIQSSKNPDALEKYLVARSVLDYEEKGMKAIDAKGLNQRQIAEKAISDLEKQYPGIKNEAKDMYTFIKNQRNVLKDGGMLNDSQMKAMDQANKNYVPMERVHEDGIQSFVNANETLQKRYANVGNPMKKRTGSQRDIISPLQTIVKRQYIYNNMAARNKVGETVLDNLTTLGKDNPFASIVGVEKNGAYKLVDAAGELAGKTEKEIPDSINSLFQDPEGKNNIVYVYKNGDKYKIQIKDKFLYDSMMSLNVKQLPGWMKILNYPTQMLRAGVTLSPDFGLRNIFRDQITTAVTSKVGYKPFYDALKGASEIIKARKGKSPIVESYVRNGGSMSVLQNIDRTNVVKSYKDLVGNKTTREKLTEIVKDPMKWLEPMRKLGEFSEMSTRVGHYKRALNSGMSPKDATYLARSTMDFNRAGTWGRQLNQGVAFFNASLQGVDVLARSLKDRPAQTLKNIGLYVTLPTAALYMMNKDQDWYKQLPADARDRNWYIPVGGQVLQLPKPFEVGILFGAGLERSLDKAFSEQDSPYKDFAKQVASAMTPDVIPTAVKPLIEVVTNHDFFTGQSIESQGDQSLNPADRYNAYNSQISIGLAKGLAALNPNSQVSPKQIDHLIKGYTGTLGSYATEGIDKVAEAVNPNVPKKPTSGVQSAPFIRSFFVKNLEGNNRSTNDFYDAYNNLRQMKKSMGNNGQTFPYAAQKKSVEKTMSAINKLQKSKKEVLNSNQIGAQQKADQIKLLNQRITELAKQGNSYKIK